MKKEHFDYERSKWASGNGAQARRWYEELESTGPENVRSLLAQLTIGSAASLRIGTEEITVGFAQQWLAWHDRQRVEREASFRQWQIFWSRWTAFAATATALVAAIGWLVTAWRKW
jgi:hypothetical protein